MFAESREIHTKAPIDLAALSQVPVVFQLTIKDLLKLVSEPKLCQQHKQFM